MMREIEEMIKAKIAELEAYRAYVQRGADVAAMPHAPQLVDHEYWTAIQQSLSGIDQQMAFYRQQLIEQA